MPDFKAVETIEKPIDMRITYQDIATKLLKDRLLLTALELHTELVESGKEMRLLKDFFSNPGNFEAHMQENPTVMSRSGSQATLDSLDLTRYSEDGEQSTDERVAVLEFQLRKAKETISALRNNLTVATESEKSTPNKSSIRHQPTDSIKPHEQRALNFLINEYLLMHGYKLTSITFADENENQDFEDWDDVGLNISKPAELLTLYREGLKQTGHDLVCAESQTDFMSKDEILQDQLALLNTEIQEYNSKITSLESQVTSLQNENVEVKKQNNVLMSNQKNFVAGENLSGSHRNKSDSSKNSTISSSSPDHFEIIDKNNLVNRTEDSIIALDDNISSNSLNEADWSDVTINNRASESLRFVNVFDCDQKSRSLSDGYKMELFNRCCVNIPFNVEYEILDNITSSEVTSDKLVCVLSDSLLRIIPNIILNKREEVIPLLISAVHLSKDSKTRDRLLQQLFNLKKKPIESERTAILTGIIGIAKHSKECLVENELLPQCWEQLAHKYTERRLLVAESCIALIPYVSGPIRNSLMLSMLQQMLEDREDIVRDAVVRAIALVIALCDDPNKYSQCEELSFRILKDSSPSVINTSTEILFPVLAKWALEIGQFGSGLVKNLLHRLNDYLKMTKSESPAKTQQLFPELALKVVAIFDRILPFTLVHVAHKEEIVDRIEKDMAIDIRPDLLNLCTNLTNPNVFYESNIGMILYEFDKLTNENSKISWFEMEWFLDNVIPDLLNSLNLIEISHRVLIEAFVTLFSHLCAVFGEHFTIFKIRPIFQSHVANLEQILSGFNNYGPSLNVIPVYLVSVLSFCDGEEVANVFKRFLYALPLCGTPLDCLEITVKGLCFRGCQEVVLTSLWDGIVHPRPLVRAASAGLLSTIVGMCNENLLIAKVTPAVVTLANDSDMLVRTATVPALGSLITDCTIVEIHDKVYMQLETYLSDGNTLENHAFLRQLIVTMGNIAISSKQSFRHEVIYPKLIGLTNYTYQMSNHTRKVDMAAALIEAFAKLSYCSVMDSHTMTYLLLPGLRHLETIARENPSLSSHHDNILSMIRSIESKLDVSSTQTNEKSTRMSSQSVEEVRLRVSKIFNNPVVTKSTTLPNLQGIFKKK